MFRIVKRNTLACIAAVALLLFSLVTVHSDELPSNDSIKRVLFKALANATNEQEARIAEGDIWQFWFDQSPTLEVRNALDAGMARREAYDYEAAENHLDRVVELAPGYAEGYNQRAFVRFLRENHIAAQSDLERALELESDHFGAMSGLFHILRIQNRRKAAMGILQRAVEIHPWLRERTALPEAMWPEPYRQLHGPGKGI